MSGGTVALVFLMLTGYQSPHMPPSYNRFVIPAGSDEPVEKPPVANADLFWAEHKLSVAFNQSGYLPQDGRAIAPMQNSMAGCRTYMRRTLPLLAEAAEQQGRIIEGARCVYVPKDHKLVDYRQSYDEHYQVKNPYQIVEEPKEPSGPACLYLRPEYPENAQMEGIEGTVISKCNEVKGMDGYYRPRGCSIIKKEGTKEFIKDKEFDQSALEFFEKGGGCGHNPGELTADGKHIYNLTYSLAGDD